MIKILIFVLLFLLELTSLRAEEVLDSWLYRERWRLVKSL